MKPCVAHRAFNASCIRCALSDVLDKLEGCVGINWTDTPASGDKPYATFDRDKAEKLLAAWLVQTMTGVKR